MAGPRRIAVKVTYGYNPAITESDTDDDTLITPETVKKEKKKATKTTTKTTESKGFAAKAVKLIERPTKDMSFARD